MSQVSASFRGEILRAPAMHTPRNAFLDANALECWADGALLIRDGKIASCGDYRDVSAAHPDTPTKDLRGGFLLPGFIDTHIHFPQLRVLGGLGLELLEWLDKVALPEEARMADLSYACGTARKFVSAMVTHGTTTALVFGAHFAPATAALFEAADSAGIRLISGLVVSDRLLRDDLHQTPDAAYRDSSALIGRFHGRGRLRYAVTPRFALSTSEAMLEVCESLLGEHRDLHFQTHLNENPSEIASVARLFPWAPDYLAVYERYNLVHERAVLAHNVHPIVPELQRLAAHKTAVAHCPCSNGALGSGVFPFRRHLEAGVACSLGTDVGGGTGFGILKEALQAYILQRLAPDALTLSPAQLLFLATRAGAKALHLEDETGDFTPGKSADLIYVRPEPGSPLASVVERADSLDKILAAIFTLGDSSAIAEVRIAGATVHAHEA